MQADFCRQLRGIRAFIFSAFHRCFFASAWGGGGPRGCRGPLNETLPATSWQPKERARGIGACGSSDAVNGEAPRVPQLLSFVQRAAVPAVFVRLALLVGNLSYDATEAHISQALQGCGGVLYVGIRRSPDTQKSRGHGQVEFATEEDALRGMERLQGLDIKGRAVRVEWCEPPLRRKYSSNQPGATGSAYRELTAQSGGPLVELFDSDGCLTAAALSAAENITVGDLEQILDEIALLLPSCGSLLQQLLQEGPLLRAALLQAQLLLGRHEPIDLSKVTAAAVKRAEGAATQRLLLECRALRPPTLPSLTVSPPLEAAVKPPASASSSSSSSSSSSCSSSSSASSSSSSSSSSSWQKKQEPTKPPAVWRASDPSRAAAPAADPRLINIISAASGGPPSWRFTPTAEGQPGGLAGLNLSPLTPEPSAAANFAEAAAAQMPGYSNTLLLPQKRGREGESQQYALCARSEGGALEDSKRTRLAGGCGAAALAKQASSQAAWLAAEEANTPAASDCLVDELLRSPELLDRVTQMKTADLAQLDLQQRQQILSLRKALRTRGKLPSTGAS